MSKSERNSMVTMEMIWAITALADQLNTEWVFIFLKDFYKKDLNARDWREHKFEILEQIYAEYLLRIDRPLIVGVVE